MTILTMFELDPEHQYTHDELETLILLHSQGHCAGRTEMVDYFYESSQGEEARARVREAKALCAQCEVRLDCLNFALRTHEKFGIWGGLSRRERQKLRRQPLRDGVRLTPQANLQVRYRSVG